MVPKNAVDGDMAFALEVSMLTGFLFGAGASRELGMPLVTGLTAKLRSLVTSDKLRKMNAVWRSEGHGIADPVVEDLVSLLASDVSYEGVLGWLETQQRRHDNSTVLQDYYGLRVWLSDVVYRILYDLHVRGSRRVDANLAYFRGLAELAESNKPLWIFNLNHDLMVECLAAKHDLPLSCGFTEEVVSLPRTGSDGREIGRLHANVLRSAMIQQRQAAFLMHGTRGVNLLKLHGSLDVFAFNDGKDLLKLRPEAGTVAAVIDALKQANEQLMYHHPDFPGERRAFLGEIVYGDDAGELQFLRRSLLGGAYKFESQNSQTVPMELLAVFQGNINFLTKLVCVGYGFGDLHVNKVILDWLRFTGERRLEIVSPGATRPAFLEHLAPQVKVIDGTATDYFDHATGIERSRSERVQKRFNAHAIEHEDDPGEQERFGEFLRRSQEVRKSNLVQKMASLPFRDGDIDLTRLGMTLAELQRSWSVDPQDAVSDTLEAYLDGRNPQ